MLNWRRFTPNGWYALAGANYFTRTIHNRVDENEPFIADLRVDGHQAWAVLDAADLTIHVEPTGSWFGAPDKHEDRFTDLLECDRDMGHWISLPLRLLPEMRTEQLLGLGFVKRPL